MGPFLPQAKGCYKMYLKVHCRRLGSISIWQEGLGGFTPVGAMFSRSPLDRDRTGMEGLILAQERARAGEMKRSLQNHEGQAGRALGPLLWVLQPLQDAPRFQPRLPGTSGNSGRLDGVVSRRLSTSPTNCNQHLYRSWPVLGISSLLPFLHLVS